MTNERFNELVKEQAVVYWLFGDDILSVDTTLINRKFCDTAIEYLDVTYNCNLTVNISDLYEYREDAQEQKEFDYIPRVELLKFPKWNDIIKKQEDKNVFFYNPRKDFRYELYIDSLKGAIFVEEDNRVIFIATLNRENYNKARRFCIKLFRGENQWKDKR